MPAEIWPLQILLQPSREELERRLTERSLKGGHFMPSSLLESQLSALEVDPDSEVFGKIFLVRFSYKQRLHFVTEGVVICLPTWV